MKSFVMLRMPILICGFALAVILSPACKAQEVSPELFTDNNTVPFEAVQRTIPAAPKKEQAKPRAATSQAPARARKTEPVQTAQLTPIHEVSKPEGQGAAAVADKRKTAPHKEKKP